MRETLDDDRRRTDVLDSGQAGRIAIRGGALRVVGYAGGLLLGLISVPLLIRHLGVADFGRYTTILSLFAIVIGVAEGGVIAVAVREYSTRVGAERRRAMRHLLGIRLALSMLAALAALGFAGLAGYDRTLVVGVALAAPGVIAQAVQAFMSVSIQAELRFAALTVQDLFTHVAIVVAVVALVLLDASLLAFLAISLPVGLAGLAVTTYLTEGRMPMRPSFDWATWRELMAESVPYAAAVAVGALYFRVAIVVMSLVTGELETGYFATSYRVVEVLILVPSILITAIFPVIARSAGTDPDRFRFAMSRSLHVAVVAGALMVVPLATGAEFVIDVIAGPEGEPAIDVLRLQALALVATFLGQTASIGLLALRRYRGILIATLTAFASNTLLTALVAPEHGAEGAAVVTVVTEFVLALSLLALLRGADARIELPGGAAARVALAAVPAATVMLLPLPDIVRALIATLLFVGALAALRGLPPELLQAARRRQAR